jgi:uncharacterized protein YegL
MSHTAEISRANPACFLFLVDQSGSMAEPFGGDTSRTKAQGVADAINRLLQTLIYRCAKGEYILDRYHIGVIGYGGEVGLGFPIEALASSVLQPVSMIAAHPLRIEDRVKRVEDGAGGLIEQRIKFPVWFEPMAQGKTPMCGALQAAHEVASGFISQHPGCFPPIVINISDGAATDGNFEPPALALWRLESRDGYVLLFNIHVSSSGQRAILFPSDDLNLPDEYAQRLFRISSPLPLPMLRQAQILESSLEDGARGFAFNADLASVIMFLDIGTRVDNNP